MNFFSKLVIVLLCVFALIFLKDNFFADKNNHILTKYKRIDKVESTKTEKKQSIQPVAKENIQLNKKETETKKSNIISIYYTNADDGELKVVYKELPQGVDRLNYALKTLFSGPSLKELNQGYSSEIPKGTRLLSVKDTGVVYIIDVSDEFQYGGGTESQYLRLRQLIKTVVSLKLTKPVYLYLNGKKAEVIGGEGILITQPLSEKSLNE